MAIKPLPDRPFLNDDSSDDGGGIDYLGLRLINLRMLAANLLPGINNATSDIGIYYLGTWLPWKFLKACGEGSEHYTEDNYKGFREAIETVMADGVKDGTKANERFGLPNRRIGVDQRLHLPGKLHFSKEGKRTDATSIYAPALYGPSFDYLGLVRRAEGKDGRTTKIHIAVDGDDVSTICNHVESRLTESELLARFSGFSYEATDRSELEVAQVAGLHPSAYRQVPAEVERSMIRVLHSHTGEGLNRRLLSTRLIVETLKQGGTMDAHALRRAWHTGLLESGRPLECNDLKLELQRLDWAIFEVRQYQRYILETFLRCFELAVDAGNTSLDLVVEQTLIWFGAYPSTLRDAISEEARAAGVDCSLSEASAWWNQSVDGGSEHYEWLEPDDPYTEPSRAVAMLCRWILRVDSWMEKYPDKKELTMGEEARISMRWFHGWLNERLDVPFPEFLRELYADLIFTQHLRVALSRLHPNEPMQRLRFVLADHGIVPTAGMEGRLGVDQAPWMADRLEAWLSLLTDVRIVTQDGEGIYGLGANAEQIK